jgi:hypothetical protein
VEYETLNLDEVKLVLQGKKLDRSITLVGGERLLGEAEKRGKAGLILGTGVGAGLGSRIDGEVSEVEGSISR